jgi:hypothetical protein
MCPETLTPGQLLFASKHLRADCDDACQVALPLLRAAWKTRLSNLLVDALEMAARFSDALKENLRDEMCDFLLSRDEQHFPVS